MITHQPSNPEPSSTQSAPVKSSLRRSSSDMTSLGPLSTGCSPTSLARSLVATSHLDLQSSIEGPFNVPPPSSPGEPESNTTTIFREDGLDAMYGSTQSAPGGGPRRGKLATASSSSRQQRGRHHPYTLTQQRIDDAFKMAQNKEAFEALNIRNTGGAAGRSSQTEYIYQATDVWLFTKQESDMNICGDADMPDGSMSASVPTAGTQKTVSPLGLSHRTTAGHSNQNQHGGGQPTLYQSLDMGPSSEATLVSEFTGKHGSLPMPTGGVTSSGNDGLVVMTAQGILRAIAPRPLGRLTRQRSASLGSLLDLARPLDASFRIASQDGHEDIVDYDAQVPSNSNAGMPSSISYPNLASVAESDLPPLPKPSARLTISIPVASSDDTFRFDDYLSPDGMEDVVGPVVQPQPTAPAQHTAASRPPLAFSPYQHTMMGPAAPHFSAPNWGFAYAGLGDQEKALERALGLSSGTQQLQALGLPPMHAGAPPTQPTLRSTRSSPKKTRARARSPTPIKTEVFTSSMPRTQSHPVRMSQLAESGAPHHPATNAVTTTNTYYMFHQIPTPVSPNTPTAYAAPMGAAVGGGNLDDFKREVERRKGELARMRMAAERQDRDAMELLTALRGMRRA